MRFISTATRLRLENMIKRISNGEDVSLNERINLQKYSSRMPHLATKLCQAIILRDLREKENLI